MANTIYCDEAGFTGNDLLSFDQPNFVYSSILIEPEEAKEIVQKMIIDHRVQSAELKGKALVNGRRGKRAAIWLLETYHDRASLIAFNKRYSLAAKCYEYLFEPVLSSHSLLFYQVMFHRFIVNVLYLHFFMGEKYSDKFLTDFQKTMRTLDFRELDGLIEMASSSTDVSPFLRQILLFSYIHKDKIIEELNSLRENQATGNWILELSITALFNLLTKWGERIEGMKVYCDESKPIVTNGDFFDVMINRQDKRYIRIGKNTYPLTFNLAQPIQTVNSKNAPGIQIADVFASSLAYALKDTNEAFSQQCLEILDKSIHPQSVYPQLEYADLETPQGFINAVILQELVDRSIHGKDLFEGMAEYIQQLFISYPEWQEKRPQNK